MHENRLAGTSLLEKGHGGDDIVSGAVANVVDLTRGVTMRSKRDHQDGTAPLFEINAEVQALPATPAVAVQEQDGGTGVISGEVPRADLFSIARRQPVRFECRLGKNRYRLGERRTRAMREPVGDSV
jgi:hypothetical protein